MTKTMLPQLSFAKLETGMPMPHLLDIQTRAFQSLLQPEQKDGTRSDVGLERVFKDLFPIQDVNGNYSLEFVKYALGEPKYTVEECIERDMTYSVPLKATLQLVGMEEVGEVTKTKRPKNIIEKEVYLGELPILTPLGTFVINGAERVIVSQLHRSPGVVFEESIHPNGQRLFSARIIPFRGSWVEFTVDIHDVIYVHIDKKKKFPATALLRAFGYGGNADILKLFYAVKDIDITGKLEGRAQKREVLGTLLAADVPDPENKKGEPLARVGDELTLERFNAFRRAGITAVRVFAGYTSLDLRDDAQPTTTQQAPSRYVLAFDVADADGEVIGEAGKELSDTLRKKLLKAAVTKVDVLLPAGRSESPLITNTLAKDPTHTEAEALAAIYTLLRPGEAPNIETAREALKRLFFHPKRYDLGKVGRYKINQRLKVNIAKDHTVLTEDDFVAIIRYLIELSEGRGYTDDIDHLGNRRVRSVGELIANQFSVGLSRMARLIKERMSINNDPERITLDDLVNARTVSAVIQAFFGSSQLSQFMDQTNPLAGRVDGRAGGLRGARRALQPVRPHVPDRDAGRAEHRVDHQPVVLRARQRPRLHRDAVPRGEERQGDRRNPLAVGVGGGGIRGGAGERAPHRGRPLRRRAGAVPQARRLPPAAAGPDRLHGRGPRAARVDRRGPDPVPGARRREPRPHGLEHAAAVGAAPLPAGAARGYGARGNGGPRLGRRRDRAPCRRGHPRHGRRDHHRRGRGGGAGGRPPAGAPQAARPLPPQEVLAHQPGHRHQPAAPGARGPEGEGGADRGRRRGHRARRAGPGRERAGGVHAVVRAQLRGRDRALGAAGQGRRVLVDPYPGARAARPRHQARP